jgi:ABC-type antimicrobial peptide transport system permease subunit
MLSYDVAARIPEIGIRMALGADATDVRRSVTLDALWPVGAGLATGAILAQALVRVIGWRLYQVSPHDSGTLAAVSGIFIAVALVAAYGPARRATRVDPIVALRHE